MEVDTRYRDMEGLQAIENESYPEALYSSDQHQRSNSDHSPELLTNNFSHTQQKHSAFVQSSTFPHDGQSTDHAVGTAKNGDSFHLGSNQQTRARRWTCGLSKGKFTVTTAMVTVLVLAAVLGGVLGSTLKDSSDEPNSENTNQPSESTDESSQKQHLPVDKTAIALLVPATSASTFAYYSTKEGLVEVEFKTGFSSNDSVTPVIIATNVKSTSPLAAVEVRPPGSSMYRTVFYLDDDNLLNFVNTTLNSSWSVLKTPPPPNRRCSEG